METLLSRADAFAAKEHEGQVRRYSGFAYIEHPREVAAIVAMATEDEEVIAAALLHDTVEDTSVTADDIRLHFGARVARLVLEVTNVARKSDGSRSVRDAINRRHVSYASNEGKTIKIADILANTKNIVAEDPEFARRYLAEKKLTLGVLRGGNERLLAAATLQIDEGLALLGEKQ